MAIKMIKNALLMVIIGATMVSCMTTKTMVGDYKTEIGNEVKYSQGKQVWIFWGLIPAGRTNINTPSSTPCKIVGKNTLLDCIIDSITFGIITTRTIRCYVKVNNE